MRLRLGDQGARQKRGHGSWSKRFSKHFKRFRESIDVTRRGAKCHSLRHNVENASRNTDVRKEVRGAIQGPGENGVASLRTHRRAPGEGDCSLVRSCSSPSTCATGPAGSTTLNREGS